MEYPSVIATRADLPKTIKVLYPVAPNSIIRSNILSLTHSLVFLPLRQEASIAPLHLFTAKKSTLKLIVSFYIG